MIERSRHAPGQSQVRGDRGGVLPGPGGRPGGPRRRGSGPLPRRPRARQPALQHVAQARRGPARAGEVRRRRSSITARRTICKPEDVHASAVRPGRRLRGQGRHRAGPISVLGKIIGINKNSSAAWRKLRSLHMTEKGLEEGSSRPINGSRSCRTPGDPSDGLARPQRSASAFVTRWRSRELERRTNPRGDRECLPQAGQAISESRSFRRTSVLGGRVLERGTRRPRRYRPGRRASRPRARRSSSPCWRSTTCSASSRWRPSRHSSAASSRARKDTLARFYLGKLYFRLEMLDDALSVLSRPRRPVATYAPTLHYLLGRIHERRGNPIGKRRPRNTVR